MGFIGRHRFEIVATISIISLFFVTRLLLLTKLPIFTDEAIYIRWAQIALQDPNWRFISLSDGKQPLFIWLAVLLLKFIQDPLLAGRLVSVISGFGSLIAIWFVAYELFKKKKIAFFASLIYVCYPFATVADRMALYDSLAGFLTLIALYFSILLVRKVRLDLAYTVGFTIGMGVLNKSTNFFGLYLLPITIILFDFGKKNVWQRLMRWALLAVVAAIIAEGMYAILRLSPLFHMVALKNALFIYPFSEWKNHPFDFFIGNLMGMTHWLFEYLGIALLFLVIVSFLDLKKNREKVLLFLYFLLPYLALALFARILFPRFIFFMTLSLLPLAAYGLSLTIDFCHKKLQRKALESSIGGFVLTIFMAYPLFVSFQFAVDPINSRIAKPDNAQYVNHWTAGWGVSESVQYLGAQAAKSKIYIATEGTFGLMPFAEEIYLIKNPNVTIKGYWPLSGNIPEEVIVASRRMPTYFIFYQPNNIVPPDVDHLHLIFKKQAGNSKYFFRLYQVVGY